MPRIPADVIEGCLLNRGVYLGLVKYRLISVTFSMGVGGFSEKRHSDISCSK